MEQTKNTKTSKSKGLFETFASSPAGVVSMIFLSVIVTLVAVIFLIKSITTSNEEKQDHIETRVYEFTVVDVKTGDTIQINLSDNHGIPVTAKVLNKNKTDF